MPETNATPAVQEFRNAEWPDRRGTVKHLKAPPTAKVGDDLYVRNANFDASDSKSKEFYGPYRVMFISQAGDDAMTAEALCYSHGGTGKKSSKPPTKVELAQQNRDLVIAKQRAEKEAAEALEASNKRIAALEAAMAARA